MVRRRKNCRSQSVAGYPATMPWHTACRQGSPITIQPADSVISTRRITTLFRAYQCYFLQPSSNLYRSEGCNITLEQLAPQQLRAGSAQLTLDLMLSGVLCDSEAPCEVQTRGYRLEVCLPVHQLAGARLCEAYGEPWQRMGSPVVANDSGPCASGACNASCFTFNMLQLARWWAALRSTSPFLTPDDTRLPALMRLKPKPRLRGASSQSIQELLRTGSGGLGVLPLNSTPASASNGGGWQRCAVVGSGHSLRCGSERGSEIDAHDAVIRANAAQTLATDVSPRMHQPPTSSDPALASREASVHDSLARFRIATSRAGSRTTLRVNCLYGEWALVSERGCIVSRRWWYQAVGAEGFSSVWHGGADGIASAGSGEQRAARTMRTSYTANRLHDAARLGLPLFWFAGAEISGDAGGLYHRLRDSSGGQALLSAMALCQKVDVYGFGLLALGGLGGEKIYSHYFDAAAGRCANISVVRAFKATERERCDAKHRSWSKREWRRDRVSLEILMHLFHAFGLVNWVR